MLGFAAPPAGFGPHQQIEARTAGGQSGEMVFGLPGEQLAHSTMVGIMGRMAGYTGQVVSWEEASEAQEDLRPSEPLSWDMKLPTPPVAMPGRTKLI